MDETAITPQSPEEQRAIKGALRAGPMPNNFGIDRLADAAVITELLYRSQDLTDDAFNDLCDDIGVRAARLVLRAKAVQGDVRAIDLYLRVSKEDKRSRTAAKTERTISGEFVPAARSAGDDAG